MFVLLCVLYSLYFRKHFTFSCSSRFNLIYLFYFILRGVCVCVYVCMSVCLNECVCLYSYGSE